MRYTTIIDLTDLPELYANVNIRLVYLHLVLRAGYHDDDRDLVMVSIRNLAYQVGITVSACRHAISILERYKLVTHTGSVWRVRKWLDDKTISPRKRKGHDAAVQERRQQAVIQDQESRRLEAIRTGQTEDPFIVYYENQMKLAEQGDAQAAMVVERRRAMYLQIKQNVTT